MRLISEIDMQVRSMEPLSEMDMVGESKMNIRKNYIYNTTLTT